MEALAACHVHSKWSYDGSWTLNDLSVEFGRRGYRAVLMTEHDRGFTPSRFAEFREACAVASSNEVLVVPGIEYSDAANRVHVLVWGVPFLGEGLPTSEILEGVRVAKGLAVLAHPTRRDAWKAYEPFWGERLLGIEMWNRKYDGWSPSQTAPALVQQTGATPFVGLDFHTHRQFFPLGMSLEIQGNAVTEETVLEALRSRRCDARAFGVSFKKKLVQQALPVLKMAERSRKAGISLVKRSKRPKK